MNWKVSHLRHDTCHCFFPTCLLTIIGCDENEGAIDVLKGHEDKIRCILNKADQIDRQQLMRVYGALLWSLGKTMTSPEVARVYVGSFWQQPLTNMDNAELFEKEEKDLMKDLAVLPRQSAVRKVNEVRWLMSNLSFALSSYRKTWPPSSSNLGFGFKLVKRIRKVKTLAYIIGYLKSQMPSLMGKEKKQQKLIADLPNVFRTILKKYNLAPGDFPVSWMLMYAVSLKWSAYPRHWHLPWPRRTGHHQFLCQTPRSEILRILNFIWKANFCLGRYSQQGYSSVDGGTLR